MAAGAAVFFGARERGSVWLAAASSAQPEPPATRRIGVAIAAALVLSVALAYAGVLQFDAVSLRAPPST